MWPLAVLGLLGLFALGSSSSSKPTIGRPLRFPFSPAPEEVPEEVENGADPAPITSSQFDAELASRTTRLAELGKELGVTFTDKNLFGPELGPGTAAFMVGEASVCPPDVNCGGVFSTDGDVDEAMDRYATGMSLWDAYSGVVPPETLDFWHAFAAHGWNSLQASSALPFWAKPIAYAFGHDPGTSNGREEAKRDIARHILGVEMRYL